MIKKLLIFVLGLVLVLPFFTFNNVDASTYPYNRTVQVEHTDLSQTTSSTTSVTTTDPFDYIAIGGGGQVLFYDVSTAYDSGKVIYNLDSTHTYYLAVDVNDSVTATTGDIFLRYSNSNSQTLNITTTDTVKEVVFTPDYDVDFNIQLYTVPNTFGSFSLDRIVLIDLTESYTAGNEPVLATLISNDFYNTFEIPFYETNNIWDSSEDIKELDSDFDLNAKLNYQGRTLEWLFSNPEFNDGITSWGYYANGGNINLSVANGIATYDIDGTRALTQLVDLVDGEDYYIAFRAKLDVADTFSVALTTDSTVSVKDTFSLTTEYDMYSTIITWDNAFTKIAFGRAVGASTSCNMDYAYVVKVPSDLTTVEEMETVLSGEILDKGVHSVGEERIYSETDYDNGFNTYIQSLGYTDGDNISGNFVRSTGKNLFSPSYWVNLSVNSTYYSAIPNGIESKAINDYRNTFLTAQYKLLPNTQYTFSALNPDGKVIDLKSKDGTTILVSSSINPLVTFTTDSEALIALKFNPSETSIAQLNNIQFQKGSVATTYEPYEEEYSHIQGTLYGKGGVYDDFDTQRFGVDYNDVVQSATGWTRTNQQTNSVIFFKDLTTELGYKVPTLNIDLSNVSLLLNDVIYKQVSQSVGFALDEVGTYYIGTTGILAIKVDVSVADSSAFETYLQANDVKFIYELDEYIPRQIGLNNLITITGKYLYEYNNPFITGGGVIGSITEDDFLYYDTPSIYGEGNEPTDEDFLTIYNTNNVSNNVDFSYQASTYYELVDSTNFFQYYLNLDGLNADIDFTLKDTLLQNPTSPLIYVTKNDLEGNYLGNLLTTTLSTTGQDGLGFNYYDFDYNLPIPSGNEDGYTYIVYNGVGGNIITAGYVYDSVSTNFSTSFDNVRSDDYAIGINNSPYVDIFNDYQFVFDDHTEYIMSPNNEAIMHYRADKTDVDSSDVDIVFNLENNNNQLTLDLNVMHYGFNPVDSGAYVEGYFPMSYDTTVPAFINSLNNAIVHSDIASNVYDTYNTYLLEIFNTGQIPEYAGYYTYYLRYDNGAGYDLKAIGETPIYASDVTTLFAFGLTTETVRLNTNVNAEVYKFDEEINYIYDDQYLKDFNTGSVYNDELSDFNDKTTISYVVSEGFEEINYNVYYYLRNNDSYKNGADVSAYDLRFSESYTILIPNTVEETVDETLDDIGMNSDLGKFAVVFVIIFGLSIGLVFLKLTLIPILIIDLILISLAVILGFLPIYLPLLLILFLVGISFIVVKFKN